MLITIALLRLNQGHKHHNLMEIINLYKLIHDNLEMEIGYKNEKWWKYMSTWQLKTPWKCPFGDYVYDADQSYLKIYHCAPAMFCCMNGLQRKNKIMLKISKGYPNIHPLFHFTPTQFAGNGHSGGYPWSDREALWVFFNIGNQQCGHAFVSSKDNDSNLIFLVALISSIFI